ncbi:MAG: 1-deoxy-D-xylulose-5-phosphate reductoisomerase [Clostridiales bacterium]|nr:1-deoxy-D-xylulose-5-phosphate reductoisomerase [Clostridiales bacterium]
MKKVAILGSTGSIGTQTLDIIRANSDKLKVHSLVAYSNVEKLTHQAQEFLPRFCGVIERDGEECLVEAVKGADIAVVATRGIVALQSVLYCLEHGIDVALANKETLVCAGELIMPRVGKARLLPVDSEHCAISQCLLGRGDSSVNKILLTASGGPFWNNDEKTLGTVTAKQALAHPNWNMGAKITVDSATMMNKALEVIEASFLFSVPVNKIQVVVHRQSIVHSMVEFDDGSVIAQLANPDMRLPIQIALLGHGNYKCQSVDFTKLLTLTFEQCNFNKFPCAQLGYEIFKYSPLSRTVMNAANDIAVESFLHGKLSFSGIYNIIIKTVERFAGDASESELSVETIKYFDKAAKAYAAELINGVIC